MDDNSNLIFTHYIVQDLWAIIVVQDKYGEVIKLLTEPLFEPEVEFEADFELDAV
jgi:hypothetical protein|tara:strand:+ start:166 stop:330 length:165 start_codon:yes stop_codon:yes gene_type:complete